MVGWLGFNGPLRQYFSLYWAVSQREGERGERIDQSKNVQTTPSEPTASAIGPCPTVIKIVGRPGTERLPSTIAPPYHPHVLMSCHYTMYEPRTAVTVKQGFERRVCKSNQDSTLANKSKR